MKERRKKERGEKKEKEDVMAETKGLQRNKAKKLFARLSGHKNETK